MSITGTLCRAAALCVVALTALPACTLRTGPPTADAYVYARPSPAIQSAPRGYYAGNTYYWYDNHWWYESPRGWAYLRHEPAPLHRYRPGVAQPPPAYGPGYGRPGYGGGYGGGPPPYVAPPLPAPR